MTETFRFTQRRLGDRRGYVAGFGVYWATCAALTAALIGPRAAIRAVGRRAETAPQQRDLDIALLAWPAVGAIATRLIPELPKSTREMVATATTLAEINAPLEELLWREVFLQLWPDNALLGWVWPSFGFAAWHVAPQVIHRSRMGTARYVGASLALGLSWGYVAWSTRSIRWATLSHVITDASGLRNSLFFLE